VSQFVDLAWQCLPMRARGVCQIDQVHAEASRLLPLSHLASIAHKASWTAFKVVLSSRTWVYSPRP
jgi:hypothetical protein